MNSTRSLQYETELELGERALFCTVLIEYDYEPGEPMVLYYPDGSGYPGSSPHAAPWNVEVTTAEIGGETLDREALMRIGGDCSWGHYLDKLVYEYVEQECESHGCLYEDLMSFAEGDPYDYEYD